MAQTKKTRTTVEIYGRPYTIIGDATKQHLRLIASTVDDKMNEIHQANKSLDTTHLAVLTAVNSVNDYVKLKKEHDELLKKLAEKEDL